VDIVAERQRPMVLHWAVNDWQLPPPESQPAGTVQASGTLIGKLQSSKVAKRVLHLMSADDPAAATRLH